jgi:methyl-accepting chemotaxis protein
MENTNNRLRKKIKSNNELRNVYAKRLYAVEMLRAVAFPSITAFVIWTAYSFYLIQSLATDIHQIQKTMINMHTKVHVNLDVLTKQIETNKNRMSKMVQAADTINQHVHNIHNNMRNMASTTQQMDASTQNMTLSVYNMQRDINNINNKIPSFPP